MRRHRPFHHVAVLHHDDLVAQRPHHPEVVGDEQVGVCRAALAGRAAVPRSAPAPSCRGAFRLIQHHRVRAQDHRGCAMAMRAAARPRIRGGSGPSSLVPARPRPGSGHPVRPSAVGTPCTASPSAKSCSTVIRGPQGCRTGPGNTICMFLADVAQLPWTAAPAASRPRKIPGPSEEINRMIASPAWSCPSRFRPHPHRFPGRPLSVAAWTACTGPPCAAQPAVDRNQTLRSRVATISGAPSVRGAGPPTDSAPHRRV